MTHGSPNKVIAYEDDSALRQQLESVFRALGEEFHLLGTFPNPAGIRAELLQLKPDIVLMDLQMLKEDDGLMALYVIKQVSPTTKVMVLTMFDADQKVFNAICLGADGYMLKSDFTANQLPHEAMRRSLRMIVEGGAYLTPSVARQIMKLFSDQSLAEKMNRVKERFQALFTSDNKKSTKGDKLTPTQAAVLEKIIEGKTSAQIAKEMGVSENTIKTHVKAIYTTLGVHSKALAIKKTMEERIISRFS